MNAKPRSRHPRILKIIFGDSPRAIASTIGIIAILAIVSAAFFTHTDEPTGLAAPWEMTSQPVDGSRYTYTPYLVPEGARYVSAQVQIGGGDGDITGFTFTAEDRTDLKPLLITLYRSDEDPAVLDDEEHPEPNRVLLGVDPGTYQVAAWYEATGDWKTQVQQVTPAEVTSTAVSN